MPLFQPDRGHGASDIAALLAGLRAGDRGAQAAFFERYVVDVERILFRLLGPDTELQDLVQESFLQALSSIGSFRGDEGALGPWLRSVAIRTALKRVRWRKARWWLGFHPPEDFLDIPASVDPSVQAALKRAHGVLDRLPPRERVAFVLRFVEGMQLREVASSCGVSLATVKRRLTSARRRFERLAERDPLLREWLRTEMSS